MNMELIENWKEAKASLETAKANEIALRNQIITEFFKDHCEEGTVIKPISDNGALKAVFKLNYKLDSEKTNQALDAMESLGPKGELIAERLVKFKPELSITEYRLLSPELKKIIDTALTTSPGTPSLEIVIKKAAE